uniref:Uncharacterized protein n=1 Tax=Candidatus Kentrum sp. DK TaxID=2126562 RepID=A0A450TK46_9GAMM|nr:MAG: hypothetical protein BECKDK2373C_GA0170839_11714 [Candidatus Kentron sp. DK]
MPTHPLIDPLTFWTLLGIFLIIAASAGRALVVWWKKDHYTREYFAVWGFGVIAGLGYAVFFEANFHPFRFKTSDHP